MRRLVIAVAFLFAAGPAAADSCSMMVSQDDLPACVKELQARISMLETQLVTERARINMYGTITCSLVTAMNKASPSPDMAFTVDAACEEVRRRLLFPKKRMHAVGKPDF